MSLANFELIATPRNDLGKGASRRLRRLEESVPAIIYGAEKPATAITLPHKDLMKALENEAFYSHILTIQLDGKAEKVVLKDLQRHPYKLKVLHADFLRVNPKQKLTMHVPIHYLNQETAPGVKEGGIVSHHLVELEIKCLPADLPEYIEVDLSNLEMDGVVHLSDVKLPKGVELTAHIDESHDAPIASVHRPRAVVEEEAAAESNSADSESSSKSGDADSKSGDSKK